MIIVFIVFSVKHGYIFLPYGVLVGVFFQMVFALTCAIRTGFNYSWCFNFKDPQLKSMLLMFLPAIAATGANQIIQIVNKGMATTVVEGGVTLISNANKMGYAAENIIVLSIAAVIYSILSKQSSSKDLEAFMNALRKGLNCTLIIMIPLSIALIIYSDAIIGLLFGHGNYIDSVAQTAKLMKVYCIGIIGLSAYTIMVRALYALKMVKHSAACAILSLIINISLCFLLSKTANMGLLGIALATSLTYIFSYIISIILLHYRIGDIGAKNIITILIKIICACIPMSILSYLTFALLSKLNNILSLLCCAVVGVAIYFIFMYIFKVDEISIIVRQIMKKQNNRRNNI